MQLQNFEKVQNVIKNEFQAKYKNVSLANESLKFSWSNWGFGIEPLEKSLMRLADNQVEYIELHGNLYEADLGYKACVVKKLLEDIGVKAVGVCGMFGPENDLSSNSGIVRQAAVDYIRRQLEFCHEVSGTYMLVVPAAVGRPTPYDDCEFERSVETLRIVADDFVSANVRAAIEPIRSAEVSIVHTIEDAKRYIKAVNHLGIAHINGDVYHMQSEEANIAHAILDAGAMLVNLHLADSNRCALGMGSMDIDAIIMALYLIDYHKGPRFVTPEPLGPGGDPYPAMFGKPDEALLDELVKQSVAYWRQREVEVKTLLEGE